jgi:DNA-binding CsgD family transcriptional regulator
MGPSVILRARADLVRVLEAAYEPAPDDESWCRGVVDAMRGIFRCSEGVAMHVVEHAPGRLEGRVRVSYGTGSSGHGMVSVAVYPEPGVVLVLCCALDRPAKPTRNDHLLLSRLGLHLESAYRLRRHPDVVKAILTLTGEREPHALHTSEDALELWAALVAGRYSLVSRLENQARRYLVLENSPRSREMRALSQRELDVLSMAARGVSTKLVSYALGLSPGTVSTALARAASKLGLATHLELLRLAATLSHDPRSRALPATLTAAETEVLALLREGRSNQEIARLRSRSVRTIANQVAALLHKTESASRRALVAEASTATLSAAPRNA